VRRRVAGPQPNGAYRGVGWLLASLVLISGAARSAPAASTARIMGHDGAILVTATGLRPGPGHAWISQLQVQTSSPASDQLDAALAAGATAVGVFHREVSVGEIPDLASCDGVTPPPSVVDEWLHYGPLLVPGRASGPAPAATATLTLPADRLVTRQGSVAVTLYFAQAGPLILDLPVDRA
jgi:hypothetical protein